MPLPISVGMHLVALVIMFANLSGIGRFWFGSLSLIVVAVCVPEDDTLRVGQSIPSVTCGMMLMVSGLFFVVATSSLSLSHLSAFPSPLCTPFYRWKSLFDSNSDSVPVFVFPANIDVCRFPLPRACHAQWGQTDGARHLLVLRSLVCLQ